MERGQVVSFEMLMITTIMLIVMGLILPQLVTVNGLVEAGETRQLAEKYLNSLANKIEMAYVMGEGAVMYEFVNTASQIGVEGGGNELSVSVNGFSKTREVNAELDDFDFNVSGDMKIKLQVVQGDVNLSSYP
jgi:hypothetical protein